MMGEKLNNDQQNSGDNYEAWLAMPDAVKKEHAQQMEVERAKAREQKSEWMKKAAQERKERARAERRERMAGTLRSVGRKVLEIVDALGKLTERKSKEKSEVHGDGSELVFRVEHGNVEQITKEASEEVEGVQDEAKEERYLNGKLTTVEEFAAAAESGTQADLRVAEYEGKDVPVYDMKGYPISMLSHDVGFSLRTGGTTLNSKNKAREIIEHPEKWLEEGDNSGRLFTLSTSYFDSESMSKPLSVREVETEQLKPNLKTEAVRYGWGYVRPNSLVKVTDTDGAVSAVYDKDRGFEGKDIQRVRDIEQRTETSDSVVASGVAVLRYDEQGKPMKPDYLIALDGRITNDTLRHAAFFGVPIVNVESRYYTEGGSSGVAAGGVDENRKSE